MSEDAVRQTRSQKRALERDSHPSAPTTPRPTTPTPSPTPATPPEAGAKRARLEGAGESAGREERVERPERAARLRAESSTTTGRSSSTTSSSSSSTTSTLLSAEVKATIKVEVQTGEEPVDMSTNPKSEIKKEKRPPSPDDDVIILSDNECPSPQMNGHFKELDTDLLMKSSPEERDRIIKQLKEELRLEEAKLVLLKRLRQSQMQKDTLPKAVGAGSVATPPPLVRGSFTAAKGSQQVLSGRSSGTVIPPPLVRGGQQLSKHGSQNSQIIMPPLVRGAPPISVSPQQLQSLRQQHHQHHQHQQHQQHSGSGPPPLMLAPRASVPSGAPGHKLLQSGGLIRVANVPTTSLLVNISQSSPTNMKSSMSSQSAGVGGVAGGNQADSPASRQAAAKLALRKQLEKTLLEIPPPKPPAPELNFLPSAANNEFIYLVGLEEVVQTLLDLGRAKQGLPIASATASAQEPYTCTQCQTDFTCRWRQDKGGAVLCEQCMSSNQKKALKAEHTSRLKAAFVKALQQEQEIEQRIMQQTAASSSPQTSSSSSSSSTVHMVKAEQLVAQQLKQQRSSLHHQHQHSISRASPSIARHHATIKQSPGSGQLSRGGVQSSGVGVGVRGVSHSFSSSSQLQSAVAAAALVARPGKSASAGSASAGGRRHGSHGNHGNNAAAAAAAVWRKPSSAGSGVTMAYVNPSLSVHKTSSSAVERQREYLLDMLPSRSLSQTANTWK